MVMPTETGYTIQRGLRSDAKHTVLPQPDRAQNMPNAEPISPPHNTHQNRFPPGIAARPRRTLPPDGLSSRPTSFLRSIATFAHAPPSTQKRSQQQYNDRRGRKQAADAVYKVFPSASASCLMPCTSAPGKPLRQPNNEALNRIRRAGHAELHQADASRQNPPGFAPLSAL